jgi:pSer/pThr/pTyr-binding forkhead associated (FHA) protein
MRYWLRSESRAALLGDDDVVIGRSSYCSLILDHASVSRLHARVRLVGDAVVIEDAESRNGTFVNDTRITAPTAVRVDDRILVGSVRVVLEPAHDRPTPETANQGASLLSETRIDEAPTRDAKR